MIGSIYLDLYKHSGKRFGHASIAAAECEECADWRYVQVLEELEDGRLQVVCVSGYAEGRKTKVSRKTIETGYALIWN